jgi:hypothetical protein
MVVFLAVDESGCADCGQALRGKSLPVAVAVAVVVLLLVALPGPLRSGE